MDLTTVVDGRRRSRLKEVSPRAFYRCLLRVSHGRVRKFAIEPETAGSARARLTSGARRECGGCARARARRVVGGGRGVWAYSRAVARREVVGRGAVTSARAPSRGAARGRGRCAARARGAREVAAQRKASPFAMPHVEGDRLRTPLETRAASVQRERARAGCSSARVRPTVGVQRGILADEPWRVQEDAPSTSPTSASSPRRGVRASTRAAHARRGVGSGAARCWRSARSRRRTRAAAAAATWVPAPRRTVCGSTTARVAAATTRRRCSSGSRRSRRCSRASAHGLGLCPPRAVLQSKTAMRRLQADRGRRRCSAPPTCRRSC